MVDQDPDRRQTISATDARGGEIILRSRRRRIIFIAGLLGLAVIAILLRLSAWV